ncbi:hypothetical protein [Nostoc sp.]|uniref:hypothetical protein n=1 Tax=Nostoc sp. TaxID=1180 RepID=UPI002FF6F2CF
MNYKQSSRKMATKGSHAMHDPKSSKTLRSLGASVVSQASGKSKVHSKIVQKLKMRKRKIYFLSDFSNI